MLNWEHIFFILITLKIKPNSYRNCEIEPVVFKSVLVVAHESDIDRREPYVKWGFDFSTQQLASSVLSYFAVMCQQSLQPDTLVHGMLVEQHQQRLRYWITAISFLSFERYPGIFYHANDVFLV